MTEGMIEFWAEPSTFDADIVSIRALVEVVVVGFFVVRFGRVLGAGAADLGGMMYQYFREHFFFKILMTIYFVCLTIDKLRKSMMLLSKA